WLPDYNRFLVSWGSGPVNDATQIFANAIAGSSGVIAGSSPFRIIDVLSGPTGHLHYSPVGFVRSLDGKKLFFIGQAKDNVVVQPVALRWQDLAVEASIDDMVPIPHDDTRIVSVTASRLRDD